MLVESHVLSQFPELVYGMSTATDGNMSYKKNDPQADENNRRFLQQLDIDPDRYHILNPELRHGGNVAVAKSMLFRHGYTEISEYSSEVMGFEKGTLRYTCTKDAYKGIDAVFSDRQRCLLSIRPADCGPLFVYDPQRKVFGIIHCSTASLFSDIIERAINMMRDYFGSKPKDILCFLGPCISVDAYELCTTGLYHRVLHKEMTPDEAAAYDPKGKIVEDLLRVSIPKANIEVSDACTASSDGKFFSNHRDQDSRRMLAVIGLR
jgi:copper oxidase (laccase) domain-containing protein